VRLCVLSLDFPSIFSPDMCNYRTMPSATVQTVTKLNGGNPWLHSGAK
jgi:hypothetical protein